MALRLSTSFNCHSKSSPATTSYGDTSTNRRNNYRISFFHQHIFYKSVHNVHMFDDFVQKLNRLNKAKVLSHKAMMM